MEQNNRKQKNLPDYPYGRLIIGSSGLRKTNSLLILIKHQTFLFVIDVYEPNYQLLIKKANKQP